MPSRVTIDATGRLVIPKPIRERHGLDAGRALEIESDGERIVLAPVAEEANLTERNGLLIVSSDLAGAPPDHRRDRDERLQRLARTGR